MNKKLKIYSSQFNYQYGTSIHFPYSIASLVSYARTIPELKDNLQFEKTFIFRNKLDEYINKCKDPDVLLCSCYVWNWEITNLLAKTIKEKYPNCTVIFGGPQVPGKYEGFFVKEGGTGNFFKDYPYVDVLVHAEGEESFKNVMMGLIKNQPLTEIKGIETKHFRALPADRIYDLDQIPSPYLTGVVTELVEPEEGVDYIAAWETNRGCPFQCTFCDWGSATKTKVRKWEMDRLFKEIEWFADNKIPYVDCCDANFGIFVERDLELAKKLKSEKLKKGYPGRIRPAWAKIASDKILPIAKELLDADLLRAVTLAVQSLDPNTLDIIKRKNIKFDKFSELVQKFRNEQIENYTELIIGMPGETLKTYKYGLEQLMELFPRPVVYIYNCGMFVNAPMNESSYREKYKIDAIKSPIYLWHSSAEGRGDIPEYEYITTSTSSFTIDDLKQKYLYGWIMQAFHSLGLLEYISKFYHQTYDVKFIEFYAMFIEFCKENPETVFGKEYKTLLEYMDIGYSGGGWNHHDPSLASIFWPIEEATWLRCVRNKQTLTEETFNFIKYLDKQKGFNNKKSLLKDLTNFQIFLLMTMEDKEMIKSLECKYDWQDYLVNNKNNILELKEFNKKYFYKNKIQENNLEKWCFEAVWVGRSTGNYKCHPEFLFKNIDLLLDNKQSEMNTVMTELKNELPSSGI